MNAIELLLSRQSDPLLTAPAPSQGDLKTILTAGQAGFTGGADPGN